MGCMIQHSGDGASESFVHASKGPVVGNGWFRAWWTGCSEYVDAQSFDWEPTFQFLCLVLR